MPRHPTRAGPTAPTGLPAPSPPIVIAPAVLPAVAWVEWLQWSLLACVVAAGIAALVIRQRMGVRRRQTAAAHAETSDDPLLVGLRFFGQGDHHAAIAQLETALEEHADLPDVRYALGVSLLRVGRFHNGLAHLEKAIQLEPEYLQFLVTRPETEGLRDQPRFEAFVRRQAQRLRDISNQGYQ